MSESLKVGYLQFNIAWENKKRNIHTIENYLKFLSSDCDVLILPEMFSTGFSMNAANLAEDEYGETISWMQSTALSYNIVLSGSIIFKDGHYFRNRLIWVQPDGKIKYYDKRHLIALSGEDKHYTKGIKREIFEYKSWKFFPSICYDLRFPAWFTNNLDYDVIINVANWPAIRAKHWKVFLKSRAIENQSYLIGVNRVGTDEKGFNYRGESAIIDFNGKTLEQSYDSMGIFYAGLRKNNLVDFRNKYPFLKDQDHIRIL